MNSVGGKIRYYRHEKRLTQEELAALVGVTKSAINKYELNKRKPDLLMLWRISKALCIPMSALYGDTSNDEAMIWSSKMENPFRNDPFMLVWEAYKRLYNKPCEAWWDTYESSGEEENYGITIFPDDGSVPQIFIFVEHPVSVQIETLGHELAHVAVGIEHDHDEVWEAAFDAIFKEYNRLGDELFSAERKDGEE